jgi:hypothetical protein
MAYSTEPTHRVNTSEMKTRPLINRAYISGASNRRRQNTHATVFKNSECISNLSTERGRLVKLKEYFKDSETHPINEFTQ